MRIELLYMDDCPSWEKGLQNLRTALQLEAIHADVDLVKIRDDREATRYKFLGSPSFRLDGRELWLEDRETHSLSCRIYLSPQGAKGWPSVDVARKIERNKDWSI